MVTIEYEYAKTKTHSIFAAEEKIQTVNLHRL